MEFDDFGTTELAALVLERFYVKWAANAKRPSSPYMNKGFFLITTMLLQTTICWFFAITVTPCFNF